MIALPKECRNATCARRGEKLDPSEFHKRAEAADGLQSWCRECARERRNEWARANRKRVTRLDRKSRRARRKRDPENHATEKARKRDWYRNDRGTLPENYRVDRPEGLELDPTPLRAVVEASGLSVSEIARRAGFVPSAVRKALKRDTMSVVMARGILEAAGTSPAEIDI